MHHTIEAFLKTYDLNKLQSMPPAMRGIKYWRHCNEVQNEEPVTYSIFQEVMNCVSAR